MMTFIITIIIMLIVVTIMAGHGYAKYREWTRRPQIHVERSLFIYHDEIHEGKINITANVYLINQGESDTGTLELEWLIMPLNKARHNSFVERGQTTVDPMSIEERSNVSIEFRLSEGDYRIAYRTYEDGYFSYEGRQTLRVLAEDVEEAPSAEEEDRADDHTPATSFAIFGISLILITLAWRKRHEKR